jgi:amino acid transporter
VRSIVANGCIYAVLALFEFRTLVVIDTILFSAGYILLFFTLVRFRALFPDTPRPFRVPGGHVGVWLVAIIPTLVAISACLVTDFKETGPGLTAAASGPLAYFVARRVGHTATGQVH